MKKTLLISNLALVAALCHFSVTASGLDDLKKALNSLQGKAPIAAEIHSSFADVRDEERWSGDVNVLLNADEHGLQIQYAKDVLLQMELEAQAKSLNEDAPTPTLDAVAKLNAINLHKFLSVATDLQQFIHKAEFVGEKHVELNGVTARQLSFNLVMETFITDKKTRKHVDDFDGSYQVWINEQGLPLESKLTFQGTGSAYIFFNVEAYGDDTEYYQVIDNRLVLMKRDSRRGSKTTFGDFERSESKQLKVLNTQGS